MQYSNKFTKELPEQAKIAAAQMLSLSIIYRNIKSPWKLSTDDFTKYLEEPVILVNPKCSSPFPVSQL